jgi:hypothetical protein
MKKISELYLSFCNRIHNLWFSNELLSYINLIDNIGYEQIIINIIYKKFNQTYKDNETCINNNLDNLRLDLTINSMTEFIIKEFDNIPIPKYGLYGYLSINKNDEILKFLIDNNKEDKILMIYIIKICADFILENSKDNIKNILKLLNINKNPTDTFDDDIHNLVNFTKESFNKINNNFKSDINNYNNDINLLNNHLLEKKYLIKLI